MRAVLHVDNLTIRGPVGTVVEGLSFDLPVGGRTALVGASGSGKSLSAAALLGQLPAGFTATGTVEVNGDAVPLDRSGRDLRQPSRGLAGVRQDSLTALNPMAQIGRQLTIPLKMQKPSALRRAAEILTAVGFENPQAVLRAYPGQLSGGQRQRVCIALALACGRSVLVADEPTTALDMVSQARVLEVLRRFTDDGAAVLLITHDIAVATSFCDEILVLHEGNLVEERTTESFLAAPRHPYSKALVGAARRNTLQPPSLSVPA